MYALDFLMIVAFFFFIHKGVILASNISYWMTYGRSSQRSKYK